MFVWICASWDERDASTMGRCSVDMIAAEVQVPYRGNREQSQTWMGLDAHTITRKTSREPQGKLGCKSASK